MPDVSHLRSLFGRTGTGPLLISEYADLAGLTAHSQAQGERKTNYLLLGLFGEVGSLLSELKKKQRDRSAYRAYARSAIEETGDVLWYFSNLVTHLGFKLEDVAVAAAAPADTGRLARSISSWVELQKQPRLFEEPASGEHVERSLLRLAARTGDLVRRSNAHSAGEDALTLQDLAQVFRVLISAADDASVSLEQAAALNLEKAVDRWPVIRDAGQLYDDDCDDDEKLPRDLPVTFREKSVGGTRFVIQTLHGVRIGDRLTDNRKDADDYRFHDVFHLSYAAILGWSPVLRALLKVKRKSHPITDEHQDGARAIITEEGIANWIFAEGVRHDAFQEVESVDFALLRTIREMVKGYEVESRPLWMWEQAILRGFAVFRELQHHRGGLVTANLMNRTLTFTPLVAPPGEDHG
ncbi:nucleoside triphosphate pyrophosphohydrolase family protein [Phenylobacterium sp.]|uniref:nucleoside triphosphate pyrophosphohydrolase family protein n=1 Tax=Phenylobacterium sp. TaxID=1871053 RepID=UPI0012162343|nr:nucleoside triphosphate pyrophosphohydrolase family protein [Phenylobacterium sp.]THD61615.1 MAG: pyrophosphatase [Phenylobacterium sp.]